MEIWKGVWHANIASESILPTRNVIFSSVTFHSFKSWLLYCFQALSKAGFHNLLFLICGVWPERNGLKAMRIWEHTEVLLQVMSVFSPNVWLHEYSFIK